MNGSSGNQNLIDFSFETSPKPVHSPIHFVPLPLINVNHRLSFDNNPFDRAEKDAALYDDPFELVSREAKSYVFDCPTESCPITNNLINIYDSPNPDVPVRSEANVRQIKPSKPRSGSIENLTNRKHDLLKLSISNSPTVNQLIRLNSPATGDSVESPIRFEAKLLLQRLASRNLSTDESSDDLMATNPVWIDSENESDNDIEKMNIPMLNIIKAGELKSPPDSIRNDLIQELEKYKHKCDDDTELLTNCNDPMSCLKTPTKKESDKEINDNNINRMIGNFRSMITKCGNNNKQAEATNLLDNLSSLLVGTGDKIETNNLLEPPVPIIRQGTFEIDKKPLTDPVNQINSSPENPELIHLIKKLEGVLGTNDQLSVVRTDEATAGSPTYIVVMSTPKSSQQLTPTDKRTRRSYSLSTMDKPQSAVQAVKLKEQLDVTPMRPPASRRSSFSFASGSVSNRKSIYTTGSPTSNVNCKDAVTPLKRQPNKLLQIGAVTKKLILPTGTVPKSRRSNQPLKAIHQPNPSTSKRKSPGTPRIFSRPAASSTPILQESPSAIGRRSMISKTSDMPNKPLVRTRSSTDLNCPIKIVPPTPEKCNKMATKLVSRLRPRSSSIGTNKENKIPMVNK